MKAIGIDYGKKRVGIALSDTSRRLAFPYCVLPNNTLLIETIGTILIQHEVGLIVIGKSVDENGKENPVMKDIMVFASHLKKITDIPIHFENEWFSSKEARQFQGRIVDIDASAAALILQRFLDTHAVY